MRSSGTTGGKLPSVIFQDDFKLRAADAASGYFGSVAGMQRKRGCGESKLHKPIRAEGLTAEAEVESVTPPSD